MTPKLSSRSLATKNNSYLFLIASSSLAAICTVRLLQWRARKRARWVADRAQHLVAEGPMIDCSNPTVRQRILRSAIQRSSHCPSLKNNLQTAVPSKNQVGGFSSNGTKLPLLSLPSQRLVLKAIPLDKLEDYRGFREVAFYEAMRWACQNKTAECELLSSSGSEMEGSETLDASRNQEGATKQGTTTDEQQSKESISDTTVLSENLNLVAMWVALFLQDTVVTDSEKTLQGCWEALQTELKFLRRLVTLHWTPTYHGVVFVKDQPYLVLQDMVAHMRLPNVLDLKMGTQTYEPRAGPIKKQREIRKYPYQSVFGFRVVGMQKASPKLNEAEGRQLWDKHFGRSLETRQDVMGALWTFFVQGNDHARFVLAQLRQKLLELRALLEENQRLAFYASSLLIAYDSSDGQVVVRMIDLSHVCREAGGDSGYRLGLRTLLSMLEETIEREMHSS